MLMTAESCTGGWIAKICTDLPGSSRWFEQGFVTYSNSAKESMLGVSAETLSAHGAVSDETVRTCCASAELLTGILRKAGESGVRKGHSNS